MPKSAAELNRELEEIVGRIETAAAAQDEEALKELFLRKQVIEVMIAALPPAPAVDIRALTSSIRVQEGNKAIRENRIKQITEQIPVIEEQLMLQDRLRNDPAGGHTPAHHKARQLPAAEYLASREATKAHLSAMKLELVKLTGRDEQFLLAQISRLEADLVDPNRIRDWAEIHAQLAALQVELDRVREWRASRDEGFLRSEIGRLEREEAEDVQTEATLRRRLEGLGNYGAMGPANALYELSQRRGARTTQLTALKEELASLLEAKSQTENAPAVQGDTHAA